jgi:hypothetical protein
MEIEVEADRELLCEKIIQKINQSQIMSMSHTSGFGAAANKTGAP